LPAPPPFPPGPAWAHRFFPHYKHNTQHKAKGAMSCRAGKGRLFRLLPQHCRQRLAIAAAGGAKAL